MFSIFLHHRQNRQIREKILVSLQVTVDKSDTSIKQKQSEREQLQ